MAFDPDAYLGEQGAAPAFDPEAYLKPAAAPKETGPTAGMSTTEKVLAGAGLGMSKVGRNLWDLQFSPANKLLNPVGGPVARAMELFGAGPHSAENWQEWNRLNRPLLGTTWSKEQLEAHAPKLPASMATGDPETDARLIANLAARERKPTGPGRLGEFVGETAATLPLAEVAGAPLRALAGPTAPLLRRVLASAAAGGAEGGTVGAVTAEDPEERARRAAGGALVGAGVSGALPVVGAAARPVAEQASEGLRSYAETAAARSTNADRAAFRRAFKGNEEARHELGAFLLDQDIPLRSPAAMREGAKALQDELGPKIGALTQAADATGATVDLSGAVQAAKAARPIADLSKNTVSRAHYDQITAMLDDQLAQHGGQVPPSVAHDIRHQIDQLADWDQAAPKPVRSAWRAARREIDSRLDDAMDQAGMANEWEKVNSDFALTKKLTNAGTQKGLADIGAERRAGNRFASPSEKAAGVLGGVTAASGAMMGHAPLGAAVGLGMPLVQAGLNRSFFPVTARVANAASRLLPRATEAATGPTASDLASYLAARGARGVPDLVQAAAGDQEPR